jgi:hypothetical protein
MTVIIQIDCEDEIDLMSHLSVIRQQIRVEIKKQGGELISEVVLEDESCYGSHNITINP